MNEKRFTFAMMLNNTIKHMVQILLCHTLKIVF